MSNDAQYLIDMFNKQLDMFSKLMHDKGLRRDKLDKYSYSSTAIRWVLNDIKECTSYIDVAHIRQILGLHMDMYESFKAHSEHEHKNFDCEMKAIMYLYSLTEVYIVD